MTTATDSKAAATLSGRELALKRRQAMALHGKTGAKPTSSAAASPATRPAQHVYAPAVTQPAMQTTAPASEAELLAQARAAATSGRSASRLRREAMSTVGKAALKPTASRPTGRVRPGKMATALESTAEVAPAKSCGCGCNGQKGGCADTQAAAMPAQALSTEPAMTASPSAPLMLAANVSAPTGRALARARRAALSQDGKTGLKRVAQAAKIAASIPGQDWQTAMTKGATGRQIAMQRRIVQSLAGRTEATSSRPSGRMRARCVSIPAPVKVEQGHTLSGREVTGTMVERSCKVTGNEPGSCRSITGTEYIGAEQYDTLCSSRPAPAPSKIGVSHTARERAVTGTEVGRSSKVTGDEPGSCRNVTGTEYLASERFQEFCSSKPLPAPSKIGVTQTDKGEILTGTMVGRSDKVTGDEAGADRVLTGTRYMANAADTAPDKVVLTHTAGGKPVTGTAVGHTPKITGDEPGSCRGITGTQYLAAEQFSTICNTAVPAHPRKVSVMSSRDSQTVSGTNVGRSDKVTGDEPGSCRAITGSQYYNQADFSSVCETRGPRKVSVMPTLGGRSVTGTEVAPSPKLTGDESYGCKPVTGTDYVATQQLAAVCDVSTPVSAVSKVVVDQTLRGLPVTGSYAGRSSKVTGNEYGGCAPISGTPYIGRSQYTGFCPSDAITEQNARLREAAPIQSITVTGDRPGAGGSVMTGDERGACKPVSGTPYVGVDTMPGACPASGRFVPRRNALPEIERPPAPLDFSIISPARAAQINRGFSDVTGTGYSSERITGPVNKAAGLITGTPEFRHRAAEVMTAAEQERIAAAQRLTGEGSQSGRVITGDAWGALSRVTGTEGASSQVRNLSERGMPRGMGVSARHFGEVVERPEIPESRITGSSGNTGKGATVTYSGGARG